MGFLAVFSSVQPICPLTLIYLLSHFDASVEKVRSVAKLNDSIIILGDFNMSDAV